MKFSIIALAVSVSLLSNLTTMAVAQQSNPNASASDERQIELIEITARKKTETAQSAPISVSVLGGLDLERAGIDNFDSVLATVPNASQSGGIAGGLQGLISIRGISTLVRFVGLETGVGYYVDGIYVGRPENFNQDLVDIDRIEVLRGPQGAVFGKNTIAGAINIITRTPDENNQAYVEAQYGNYNHMRLKAGISGELTENLFGSLSGSIFKRDGIIENSFPGGDDLDDADLTTLRTKIKYQASDAVELVFAADLLKDRSNPAFFEVRDAAFLDDPSESTPFTVNSDQPNFLDRDIWGASLSVNVELSSGTWETVLAMRDTSFDAGIDDDKLPVRFFVDEFSSDTDFQSLESRYSSQIGDTQYQVGVYLFTQDADNISNFALGDFLTGVPGVEPPIDLTSSVDTDSYALFFNTDTQLSDALSLEIGGRYVSEDKSAFHLQEDQTGIFGTTDFSADRSDSDFSPIVSLSYSLSDNAIAYTRYAEGFKSAGFNTDFISAGANLEVEPETATSVEAGLKTFFFNRAINLNVAAFQTDYENLQLAQIVGAGVSLNNAAEADIRGIELDFTALVGDYFDVYGNMGYLDATYDDFPGCPAPGAIEITPQENCAGNFLNIAPEWTAGFGAQMVYPLAGLEMDLVLRADYNYRSEVFFEPQNETRLSGDSRSIMNLRVGLMDDVGSWEVFAWVNNLFDEEYVNFADDRSGIFVPTTEAFGAPRMYGVTVRMRFE
ncbi:TonB-dependent receptor [Ningiella sp. W23]|uniref:TonB-dependent receptor n=1 Tax=Ningiella sp. W23 TaxID=3023715 RepID=UPI003756A13A